MKRNIRIIGRASMAGLAAALAGCITSVRSTWDQSPDGTIHAAVSVRSTGTQSEALAKGFDAGPQGSILRGTPGGETVHSAERFTGSPGPAGEGVYGRASCARCQAYAAAHPDARLIDLDSGANRADMWAAPTCGPRSG